MMKRLAVLVSLIALLGTANLARADIFMRQLQHMDAFQMMGQSQPATDVEVSVWITDKGMRSDNPKQSAIERSSRCLWTPMRWRPTWLAKVKT
jgi:hypothetical protein